MKIKYNNKKPMISNESYVAENSAIIGDVILEDHSSIWFGAVLRADVNTIKIGKGSNIQDNCTVHVDDDYDVIVGENVTVGHNVVLHGCKIGDDSLIGMGSIILDGAVIGSNTIIGAGSLVTSNKEIPSGVLCLGSPAKAIRELTEEEIESIKNSSKHYIELSKEYMDK